MIALLFFGLWLCAGLLTVVIGARYFGLLDDWPKSENLIAGVVILIWPIVIFIGLLSLTGKFVRKLV